MELAGRHFIAYAKKTPHGQLLELMGSNPVEVLSNVNKLHSHLLKTAHFPGIVSPSFRCTHKKANSVHLHYIPGKSSRVGLSPFVQGILKGLLEDMLLCSNVSIQQIKTREEHQHDVYQISWAPRDQNVSDGTCTEDHSTSTNTLSINELMPMKHGLRARDVARLYPFHIMFDKQCDVVQAGRSLQKIIPGLDIGEPMSQHFSIKEPESCSFENFSSILSKRKFTPFALRHQFDDQKQLVLNGEMVWNKSHSVMCFACIPILNSLEEVKSLGLDISDFALCDQAQAKLLILHAQNAQLPVKEKDAILTLKEDLHIKEREKKGFLRSFFPSPNLVRRKASEIENNLMDVPVKSNGRASRELAPGHYLPPYGIKRTVSDEPRSLARPDPVSRSKRLLYAFQETLLSDASHGFIFIRTLLNSVMQKDSPDEVKKVFEATVKFYRPFGKLCSLVENALTDEIRGQSESGLLFRADSTTLRLWSAFMNHEADSYRRHCVGPLFQAVQTLDKPLQIVPAKCASETERNENLEKLICLAQSFLDHVCASANACPISVRVVLSTVITAFPDRGIGLHSMVISSLLFLRFLSPASCGQDHSSEATQQTLLIISKMVNNLINDVSFGEKESSMALLDKFISPQNKHAVERFFNQLTNEDAISADYRETNGRAPLPQEACPDFFPVSMALDAIRQALSRHLAAMWKNASNDPVIEHQLQQLFSVALCDMSVDLCF